jgi:mechanosensitive ion channel protein 1/2/3
MLVSLSLVTLYFEFSYACWFLFLRATLVAPSISTYVPQALRGAFVLSFVWFLQRWKTNFIAKAMTNLDASSVDRDKISVFDKVSSLGLIGLGVMGIAEACGVAVQSILTVGGVGGNLF